MLQPVAARAVHRMPTIRLTPPAVLEMYTPVAREPILRALTCLPSIEYRRTAPALCRSCLLCDPGR